MAGAALAARRTGLRRRHSRRRGPPGCGTAVASLVLGLLGLIVVTMSLGLLFIVLAAAVGERLGLGSLGVALELPRATCIAVAGKVLGIVGTLLAIAAIAGCAALIF